eukprot:2564737-Rhodomonas_salina.1
MAAALTTMATAVFVNGELYVAGGWDGSRYCLLSSYAMILVLMCTYSVLTWSMLLRARYNVSGTDWGMLLRTEYCRRWSVSIWTPHVGSKSAI